jgi:hypothetical protein
MVMRRKYSLPNCTLVLEGLSPAIDSGATPEASSIVSMLVNAECNIQGHPRTLSGGREFFESFVTAVSQYAQSRLNGISVLKPDPDRLELVQITPIEHNLHRMTVAEIPEGRTSEATAAAQVDLTTVQLFDLMEAVDRFLMDSSTLPDWSLQLQPISRRLANTGEPLTKRAAPAAIGVSGLAIAALTLFYLPIPEVRQPEEPTSQSTNSESVEGQATSGASPPTPELPANTSEIAKTPASSATTPATQPAATASSKSEASSTVPPTEIQEITDASQLQVLKRYLHQKVNQAWTDRSDVKSALIYRVTVGQDGSIIGYKPENDAAKNFSGETPLKKLAVVLPGGGRTTAESQGQFKVVFNESGVPEVSPWSGYQGEPSPPPEITDETELDRISKEMREEIIRQWKTAPIFEQGLEFRVGVTKEGKIAEFEPINQPAFDYVGETPLPAMRDPDAAIQVKDGVVEPVPLAQYKVVFTPRGVPEVGKW